MKRTAKVVSLALGLCCSFLLVSCSQAASTNSSFTESPLPGGGIQIPHNERIHLSTDQQWISSEGHLSDLIRLQWTGDRAKPAISWANEKGEDKTAIISHEKANNAEQHDHKHLSIETTMSPTGKNAGELFTRFEVPYDVDTAEIRTHSSNFNVMDGILRVAGEPDTNRDLQFSKSEQGNVTTPRWGIRADSASEGGGNAGSNLQIVRYSDSGEVMDSPLYISRSNGNVGVGASDPQTKLDVDDNSVRIRQSFTPASSTSPGVQGEVAWDEKYVYVCVAPNTWKRTELSSW
ncbi:hypothetical protein [Ammoniphilus resinae]|uniref:Uncharacterized protein n=1 Tax=Ammoniphilus resinae TaxID=861532 RepID=A0ABS4GXX5_9BACL|nr:hypothetical protein [Ammoniphilus resinae]MBP1934947.1 hypothetical protein [Ammoniphilus resinae]